MWGSHSCNKAPVKKKYQLIQLGKFGRVGWSQGEAFKQKAAFCMAEGFPNTFTSSAPNTKLLNKINLPEGSCTAKHAHVRPTLMICFTRTVMKSCCVIWLFRRNSWPGGSINYEGVRKKHNTQQKIRADSGERQPDIWFPAQNLPLITGQFIFS